MPFTDNLQNQRASQSSPKTVNYDMSRMYYTKFNFSEDLREAQKFADFAKLSTLTENKLFQFVSKLCTYLSYIHVSNNNSEVRRSSYTS